MAEVHAKKSLPIPRPRKAKASPEVARKSKPGASTPPRGKTFAGRYVLDRMLGRGSMGSVWLAVDERLQRRVAVKILGSMWAESRDARARFEREARAVAKLHSPHIVQVFDYGIEDGRPFIVMELLDGEDLHARLKRQRRLSLHETASIVLQACRALHVAHKAHIVHRDLKPGNLMVDHSTGDDLVKVLDFGVAKARADQETEATKAGTLLGTPQYMAPEQARALPDVDHRADLWSIGVIAYRALTGQAPFQAKSVTDMIVQICTTTPKPVTALQPDLPPLADVFFSRALARDRDKRFASARELASSFYRLIDSSAPSMSLSVLDSSRLPVIGAEAAPASFPLPDSFPTEPDAEQNVLSSTNVTVSSSIREASGIDSEPLSTGGGPAADTLSSALDAAERSSAHSDQPSRSSSFGTEAAVVSNVRPHKRRGWLLLTLAAFAAIAIGFVLVAARRGAHGTATTSGPPSGTAVALTPASTAASSVAVPSSAATTSRAAATRSAAPATSTTKAAASAGSATARTTHPPRRVPRPTAATTTHHRPPHQQTKPDDSDLLGERY